MSKSMIVPESFLIDAYTVLADVLSDDIHNRTIDACKRMETVLKEKIDALKKREAYTASKTAETPEEREAARRKYVELVDMPSSFRYSAKYVSERDKAIVAPE